MKKINKFFNSLVEINLEGLNFEKLLFFMKKNNVYLFNVDRPEYNLLSFSVNYLDYKKLNKLKAFKNYKVNVLKYYGFINLLKNYKQKIGLLLGIILSVVVFSIFSMFTFKIQIIGVKSINENVVLNLLKSKNIKTGQINNFNNEELEIFLKQSINDISLVSIIKKGTNIVISIKEKERIVFNSDNDIIAPVNSIIVKIEVNQGTALKKAGDVVVKGEPIVAPYIINDAGEKISVEPIVELELDAWYVGSVEFDSEKVVNLRTGKSFTNSFFSIGKLIILKSEKNNLYNLFEEKQYENYLFNNFFLPIKFSKITYYQLKQETQQYSFEKNKENLINKSRELALNQFPVDEQVLEEKTVISQVGTKYYVQTYMRCLIKIKNN